MAAKKIKLKTPKQSEALDMVRIAKIELERNPFKGTNWALFYVVIGKEVEGEFVQYADPQTGAEAAAVQIEDGHHPLSPSMALGKCDTCDTWYPAMSGVCTEIGCSGAIEPYDGFTRLLDENSGGGGGKLIDKLWDGCYDFLMVEEVPDPNDWGTLVPVLDAEEV